MNRAAFTLIELIVTMVIVAIIATIGIGVLVSATSLYTTSVASRQVSTDVNMAMDRLLRETRCMSSAGTNPVVADTNTFSFVNQDGSFVTFQLSGTNLLLSGNLLLAGVQTFSLDYYDSTNGLLTPRPLELAKRRRVRAACVNLGASAGGQTETLKNYVFWPPSGVRR